MHRIACVIVLALSGLLAPSQSWSNTIEYCMRYRGAADSLYLKYENELDLRCQMLADKLTGKACSSDDRQFAHDIVTYSLRGKTGEVELLELLELAAIAADTGMPKEEFVQTAYLMCMSQ